MGTNRMTDICDVIIKTGQNGLAYFYCFPFILILLLPLLSGESSSDKIIGWVVAIFWFQKVLYFMFTLLLEKRLRTSGYVDLKYPPHYSLHTALNFSVLTGLLLNFESTSSQDSILLWCFVFISSELIRMGQLAKVIVWKERKFEPAFSEYFTTVLILINPVAGSWVLRTRLMELWYPSIGSSR